MRDVVNGDFVSSGAESAAVIDVLCVVGDFSVERNSKKMAVEEGLEGHQVPLFSIDTHGS